MPERYNVNDFVAACGFPRRGDFAAAKKEGILSDLGELIEFGGRKMWIFSKGETYRGAFYVAARALGFSRPASAEVATAAGLEGSPDYLACWRSAEGHMDTLCLCSGQEMELAELIKTKVAVFINCKGIREQVDRHLEGCPAISV